MLHWLDADKRGERVLVCQAETVSTDMLESPQPSPPPIKRRQVAINGIHSPFEFAPRSFFGTVTFAPYRLKHDSALDTPKVCLGSGQAGPAEIRNRSLLTSSGSLATLARRRVRWWTARAWRRS